jgi:hypothetical protein
MVGREALITAVAISICAHVKAGSSEPVSGISLFYIFFPGGTLTRNVCGVDLEQKNKTVDADKNNTTIVSTRVYQC